jgi:hypothetical protein
MTTVFVARLVTHLGRAWHFGSKHELGHGTLIATTPASCEGSATAALRRSSFAKPIVAMMGALAAISLRKVAAASFV